MIELMKWKDLSRRWRKKHTREDVSGCEEDNLGELIDSNQVNKNYFSLWFYFCLGN